MTNQLRLLLTLLVSTSLASSTAWAQTSLEPVLLHDGWKLQSSCVDHSAGREISSTSFRSTGWIPTTVPHTVLGAQVDAGVFPHPFLGKNFRDIPGTDYPEGKIFGYLPMAESSPYHCSWWYRKEFTSNAPRARRLRLRFDGLNYRANVWLNGYELGTSNQIAGTFRAFDLDVSDKVKRGVANVLAVEVLAQTENDLGIDFLDWNPAPADKNLGLWRDVSLMESGPATLGKPFVVTHFTDDSLSTAELTVAADLQNLTDLPVSGVVLVAMKGTAFQQRVELAPMEHKEVRFAAREFPQLRIEHPLIWWPYQYGAPNLQALQMRLEVNGTLSDQKAIHFGIREVDESLDRHDHALFRVNRHNLLIRGAGFTPDLFYREPSKRIDQEMVYVRNMHLNTVRLEGKLGSEELFDAADRLGILVLAGWQCCDQWQHWDKWTAEDHIIANASLFDQITRLRSHPSMLGWLNGSDENPPPTVEKDFLAILLERSWPAAILSAAADRKSTISGKSGVKMSGPYDYEPPEYWYLDKDKYGGAFGFNTETSPGPAIPLESSIERTLPKKSWWPIDEQWAFHAGLGRFAQFDLFRQAMVTTYGDTNDPHQFNLRAQWMAYDAERAMYEAYGANKYAATGVVQWMLNNAWPSFIWHLYDYYLVPGGGFFGTKKANEPVHVQYSYDDRKIIVVNSTLSTYNDLRLDVHVWTLEGRSVFEKTLPVTLKPDGVAPILSVPKQSATTFLQLHLTDGDGQVLSENIYAVPAKLAEMDWSNGTPWYTRAVHYADMRDLNQLATARVAFSVSRGPSEGRYFVHLKNASPIVAFCLQLRASPTGKQEDIAPVDWTDNYFSLAPGETRTIEVGLPASRRSSVTFALRGWNTQVQTSSAK